jgi:Fe-S cluster assembly protein SufD
MYLVLQESFEKLSKSSLLSSVRMRFWDRFQTMGMPSKKLPGYQYIPSTTFAEVNLLKSSEEALSSFVPSNDEPCLVFVEGSFSKELSTLSGLDKSIIIEPLSTAYKTYGSYLNQNFTKSLKAETDPLVILNHALCQEALFIYIPPHVKVQKPIRVVLAASKGFVTPRMHIFASANSSCEFALETVEGGSYFNAEVIDIIADESASVEVYYKKRTSNAFHFSFLRAQLKKQSFLKTTSYLGLQPVEKSDYKILLSGPEARAELYGLSLPTGSNSCHVNVFMEHMAENTTSKQHFKGALFDNAKASFEGKIYVHQDAMKTDAFQLNNYLLLSPNVVANSKPNLEIFADDVKASHGATVGQINKEALFYLKSRGIEDSRAKELLIDGFIEEIKQQMPDYLR